MYFMHYIEFETLFPSHQRLKLMSVIKYLLVFYSRVNSFVQQRTDVMIKDVFSKEYCKRFFVSLK